MLPAGRGRKKQTGCKTCRVFENQEEKRLETHGKLIADHDN